jgi:hypothetical protein
VQKQSVFTDLIMQLYSLVIFISLLCWDISMVDALKPPMSINARCAGKTYEVQVEGRDTVGEVCSALCKSNRMAIGQQSVFYRGKVLDKKKSITESGIGHGDTISIKSKSNEPRSPSSIPISSLKSSDTIKQDIKHFNKVVLGGKSTKSNTQSKNKPVWDLKNLQSMLGSGAGPGGDKDFLASVTDSLKTNPMDMIGELMGNNYLEDLVSSDSALVSHCLFIIKNVL